MRRRLLFPLALLAVMLAVPATGHAYTLGVSDQQASTFANPLFDALKCAQLVGDAPPPDLGAELLDDRGGRYGAHRPDSAR